MGLSPPSPRKGHNSPHITVHVYCGQTTGWIRIPVGTEVYRPRSRRQCVRWGPSSPTDKEAQQPLHPPFPPLLWHGRPSQQLLSSGFDSYRLQKFNKDSFVHVQYTWPCTWPRTGRVHSYVHGPYTIVYTGPIHTGIRTRPYTSVHGPNMSLFTVVYRNDGRILGRLLTVSTAMNTGVCSRPCVDGAVYTACTRSGTRPVLGAYTARVHVYTSTYTIVTREQGPNTAVYTAV